MRHNNSVFHDVLKRVPWAVFDRLVEEHGADKHVRRLSTKTQLIALLYGQLAGAVSLREIATLDVNRPAEPRTFDVLDGDAHGTRVVIETTQRPARPADVCAFVGLF